MQILIISLYDPIPGDPVGLIRYPCLAEAFEEKGISVTYVTGSFFHLSKAQRTTPGTAGFPIHLLKVPSYKKNIDLGRIYSHFVFGRRLKKYLDRHGKDADLIISAFPPIYSNYVLSKWADKNHKRYWIDIQDLWPEAFEGVMGAKWLSGIFLSWSFNMRKRILANAMGITAVTKDYLELLHQETSDRVFPLGMEDPRSFSEVNSLDLPEKTDGEIWVVFLGNSSRIPFLKTLIRNWSSMPSNYTLVCAGVSGLFQEENKPSANVHTFFEPTQSQKEAILANGDVGLVIHDPALLTRMPYKTFAYLGHGMKVLTHIRGGELASWIEEHKLGEMFEENLEDFREKLIALGRPEKDRITSWAKANLSKSVIYSKFAEEVLSEMR